MKKILAAAFALFTVAAVATPAHADATATRSGRTVTFANDAAVPDDDTVTFHYASACTSRCSFFRLTGSPAVTVTPVPGGFDLTTTVPDGTSFNVVGPAT